MRQTCSVVSDLDAVSIWDTKTSVQFNLLKSTTFLTCSWFFKLISLKPRNVLIFLVFQPHRSWGPCSHSNTSLVLTSYCSSTKPSVVLALSCPTAVIFGITLPLLICMLDFWVSQFDLSTLLHLLPRLNNWLLTVKLLLSPLPLLFWMLLSDTPLMVHLLLKTWFPNTRRTAVSAQKYCLHR